MPSFSADSADFLTATRIQPALTSFSDEVCATVARLFAYVGTLALMTILAIHGWDRLQITIAEEPAPKPGWALADRSHPAFALGQPDPSEKSAAYTILRHPSGGRKDVLRWMEANGRVSSELEIYRLGTEFPSLSEGAELAARMKETGDLEGAGVVDTKFGLVPLFHRAGAKERGSCIGFIKRIDDPALEISGFSCHGDTLPARRTAIACMLNRLTLLASGNEPKLGELFARAELRRASCGGPIASAVSEDWMTGPENPRLRGTF
jgi:hypothetical protein